MNAGLCQTTHGANEGPMLTCRYADTFRKLIGLVVLALAYPFITPEVHAGAPAA